jgi:hypothetical protein
MRLITALLVVAHGVAAASELPAADVTRSQEKIFAAPAPPPQIAPFGDATFWVVLAPIKYRIWKTDDFVIIPRGFVTDLASIPQAFWSLLPKTGKYMSAAILHDFLYYDQRCGKDNADLIFKMEMDLFGITTTESYLIYTAVKELGATAWRQNGEMLSRAESRFMNSRTLDSYLSEELDAAKTWKLLKNVERNDLMGQRHPSTDLNKSIKRICVSAVSQYMRSTK